MTIIVFLIDTSASMNQRAYLGGRPTLLDVAKGAVETFVKVCGCIIFAILLVPFSLGTTEKCDAQFYLFRRFVKDPLKVEVIGTCY
jgi:hypothetical protein